jgi:hypothetical protein
VFIGVGWWGEGMDSVEVGFDVDVTFGDDRKRCCSDDENP